MCKYLKSNKVVEPIMKYVHEYVQSPNPHARKAAISALTVLVRNCADALQEKLSALLPYVSHWQVTLRVNTNLIIRYF